MRSFAFLLTRRWLIFAVVVALLTWLAWWLGEWQFGRLEDRRAKNSQVVANEKAEPAPVDEVMSTDGGPDSGDEWRLVTATGEYDTDNTVIIRYRTREGEAGVDVVVPLVTEDGTAVAVDRGWMPTENRGGNPDDVPEPPQGTVTMTGWLRIDSGDSSAKVVDHSARSVSGEQIGSALDLPMYRGFVDLHEEDPEPAESLAPVELPDLGEGPHFFYGLQWWFFGLLAVVGFGWLARDEWRKSRGGKGSGPNPGRSDDADPPGPDPQGDDPQRPDVGAPTQDGEGSPGASPDTSPGTSPDLSRDTSAEQDSEAALHPAVDRDHGSGDVRSRG